MAEKGTTKSPSGRTSKREPEEKNIGGGASRQKKEEQKVALSIAQEMRNKRESILRMLDLQQTLDQSLLGLTKRGDMNPEITAIIKRLKQRKQKLN